MALQVEKGTFTKTTSTSTPVSQTVNLVDSTLTPKAVILWTTGGTTSSDTYSDDSRFSYGFSDGTNHACQSFRMDESLEAEAYVFYNNKAITVINAASATVDSVAHVSATAAGSFTLSWTTQADLTACIIHYIAIGGSDIANASVVTGTATDTLTGNHSWNGSGTTFTPEFALTMTGADGYTSTNTISGSADVSTIAVGATDGTRQWVVSGRDETIGTSDCDMYINDAACMANHDPANGSIDYLANFVSFNSAAGGGITVNVTNAATSASQPVAFLLLKGSSTAVFECGTFQQRSGTGTQDVSFVNTALDPSLVFIGGINTATNATVTANMYLGFGASDGTREGCSYFGNANGLGTFTAVRTDSSTKVYKISTPAATATSSTTNAEADMNDMATAGKFQLSWTTADTTLRMMAFWTLGTQPLYVSQTSIQKYDIAAYATQTSIHKYHVGDLFLKTKVGIITKDTTTGAHTQNFTSELGFRPSAMILWSTSRTATGVGAGMHNVIGFTDGTNHFCSSAYAQDNTNSGNRLGYRNMNTHCIVIENTPAGTTTTLSEATVTFQNNGFDVEWTKADATQNKIMYWAIGGSKIDNAKVTSQAHAGTGSRTYSTTGFQGNIAFFVGAPLGITSSSTGMGFSFGAATGSSNQFCISVHSTSPFAVDCGRSQLTDKCIRGVTGGASPTVSTDAAFTAFTSTGYTLNYSSANTGHQFAALVIKGATTNGALFDLGTFNQATSNGTQQVNITTDRTPKTVLFSSFGDAATTSVLDHSRSSFGLMDGTSETSVWSTFQDAASPNQVAKMDLSDTKVCRTLSETSGGTLQTEADFSSFQDDSFTINNTTTDGTSRQICYVCLSEEAAGTTPVSETSIHKYNITGNALQTSIHKYDLSAYIAQTSIHKYNLLNNIIQSSIHKYNLLQNVLQSSIHKYDIIAQVLRASIHKYDILNTVTGTNIHKYNILQNVLQSSIQKYHVFANILQSSIHKYNMDGLVAALSIHKYDIRAYIAQTSIHKYNLLNNILQSSIHKYNLLANILQSSIHKYDILANILQTSIQKYNILANVLQTSIHKYNLLAYILQTSIHKFDIQVLGAVVNALIAKYDILQNVVQTNVHKYDVLQNVLQSSIHKYNLLVNILQNSIHKYNVLQNIAQTSIHKFDLLQNIVQSSIQKYDILIEALTVLANSIHKFDVIANIAQTSIHKYDVLNTVSRTSIHKYNILKDVLQSNIHKYVMGGRISETSRHLYQIVSDRLISFMAGGKARRGIPTSTKLKEIRYPVYSVSELRYWERRRKLREFNPVIKRAFSENINSTVAPFVVTNPQKHTVSVKFAVKAPQNVRFVGKTVPILIASRKDRKQMHKARCASFVMNQKAIKKYGNRLNRLSKVLKLLLLAENNPFKE